MNSALKLWRDCVENPFDPGPFVAGEFVCMNTRVCGRTGVEAGGQPWVSVLSIILLVSETRSPTGLEFAKYRRPAIVLLGIFLPLPSDCWGLHQYACFLKLLLNFFMTFILIIFFPSPRSSQLLPTSLLHVFSI